MMTQTRLGATGASQFVTYNQQDGYQQTAKNWRINTGFKKLQKRILDRQKSGRSVDKPPLPVLNTSARKSGLVTSSRLQKSTSAFTSVYQNDVTDDISRKDNNKLPQSKSLLWRSATTSGGKTPALDKKGQSEFSTSLQYELYRTSNNGLARISARMKKNAFRMPSQASGDFSDSSSFEADKSSEKTIQQKLPVLKKPNPALLKEQVERLDSRYEADFEEDLEDRIVRWINNCKLWDTFEEQPYSDLDKKSRKSSSKTRVTLTPRSKVTDANQLLDRSKTCL